MVNAWRTAIALLIISMLTTVWLIVGSFVTYAPPITPWAMQNLYLRRIVRYGVVIGLLQLTAVILLILRPKPDRPTME